MMIARLAGFFFAGMLAPRGVAARLPVRRAFPDLGFRLPSLGLLSLVLVVLWLILHSFYADVALIGRTFLHRTESVFATAAMISSLILFFAALPPARSLFLQEAENELLLTLPFRTSAVAAARFIALWLLLLPAELFILSPALVAYLTWERAGWNVVWGVFIHVFFVPLPPAACALGVMLGAGRLPRFSRWAPAVEAGGAALIVFIMAVIQVALQNGLASAARDEGIPFSLQAAIFLSRLLEAVQPAAWAAAVFRHDAALSGFFSVGAGVAFAAAAVLCASRAFPSESVWKRVEPRGKGRRKRFAFYKNVFPSLIMREAALFFSRPGLAGETALRLFALPVFLLLYVTAGAHEVAAALSGFIASSRAAALAAIGILLFSADVSFLAASAVSREGLLFTESLSLPHDGGLYVKAKFLFLLLLALPPACLTLALVSLFFSVPAESLVCAVPGLVAYFVFSIAVGLFFDLRRPRFDIASSLRPAGAISSSTILAGAVAAAAIVLLGLVAGAAMALGFSPLAAGFSAVTVLAALDIALVPRLFRYARRRYADELEG